MITFHNLKTFGAALLISAALFSACKKDETTEEPSTPTTPTQSNTEKILGKPYKVTGLRIVLPFGGVDLYSQLKPCETDNLLYFEAANLYKQDEGASKCDSMANQSTTGTWQWKSNETEIAVTASGQSWTWKVLTNDGTILKVSVPKDTMGLTASVETTMTKQP